MVLITTKRNIKYIIIILIDKTLQLLTFDPSTQYAQRKSKGRFIGMILTVYLVYYDEMVKNEKLSDKMFSSFLKQFECMLKFYLIVIENVQEKYTNEKSQEIFSLIFKMLQFLYV